MRRILGLIRRISVRVAVTGVLVILLPCLLTAVHASKRIYQAQAVPAGRVAIFFGTGLRMDSTPTAILSDRVQMALYLSGKVENLLLSGDNSVDSYSEPEAMRQYVTSLGVRVEDIAVDYASRRTYDTC